MISTARNEWRHTATWQKTDGDMTEDGCATFLLTWTAEVSPNADARPLNGLSEGVAANDEFVVTGFPRTVFWSRFHLVAELTCCCFGSAFRHLQVYLKMWTNGKKQDNRLSQTHAADEACMKLDVFTRHSRKEYAIIVSTACCNVRKCGRKNYCSKTSCEMIKSNCQLTFWTSCPVLVQRLFWGLRNLLKKTHTSTVCQFSFIPIH